jgi:ParB family transcriptional regulator, chromosome partitioning protein
LYGNNPISGIVQDLEVSKLRPPLHSVRLDDQIADLVTSISKIGLLQPIVVRLTERDDFYEVVAGYRRFQACKKLGYKKISSHVVKLGDKEAFEVSLMENLDRSSLDAIEEGQAFKKYVSDFGWGGVSELASKIGKSASYVTKRIMLLDLPQEILNSITSNVLSVSTAEELLKMEDTDRQSSLAHLINERHLTIKQVRGILKETDIDGRFYDDENNYHGGDLDDFRRIHKSFDKAILSLRIALSNFGGIIEDVQDNWVVYELLMRHKNAIHTEIDHMLNEKKKYRSWITRKDSTVNIKVNVTN